MAVTEGERFHELVRKAASARRRGDYVAAADATAELLLGPDPTPHGHDEDERPQPISGSDSRVGREGYRQAITKAVMDYAAVVTSTQREQYQKGNFVAVAVRRATALAVVEQAVDDLIEAVTQEVLDDGHQNEESAHD